MAGIGGRKDCQRRSRAILIDICWEGHHNVYEKLNKFNLYFSGEGTGCRQVKDPQGHTHSKSMDLGPLASILELQPHCRSVCAFRTSPLFLPQDLCTYCHHRLEDVTSPLHAIYLLFRLWCHFLKYLSPQPSPIPYSASSKPQSPYDSTPRSCNFIFIYVII